MSYTPNDVGNLVWEINDALKSRDSEKLFTLAQQLKVLGEDEEAQSIRYEARRIEREDNYHDEKQDYV